MHHLGHRRLQGEGGSLEHSLVQMAQSLRLLVVLLAGRLLLDQAAGQLHQLIGEGEQQDGVGQVEAGVEDGNLHRVDGFGRKLRVQGEQQDARRPEQQGADDVEAQVDARRPLRRAGAADAGDHGGGAGADVLPQGDVDGRAGGNHAI